MLFLRSLIRTAPIRKEERFRVLKSVLLRIGGKSQAEPYPWKWQLRLFIGLLKRFWSLPFKLRKAPPHLHTVYYDNVTGEESVARRTYFIHKHACPEADAKGILALGERPETCVLYYRNLSLGKCWTIHRIAWRFLWAAFLGLFEKSRIHWMWKLRTANDLLQQVLLHAPDIRQYHFFSYEPNTYLGSFLAQRLISGYQPRVISSNSVFFRDNRYLYHPELHFYLCSKFQTEESRSYRELGWMEVKKTELWGLEEALVLDQVPQTEPTQDIGIFSSGFWARTEGLWRSGKIEDVRAYKYIGNPLYKVFSDILATVLELKSELNLRVKVYLHPYEEALYRNHDIRPPYLDLLDEHGVAYEIGGKTTLDNFYEPKVGLSVCSTAVFDHLHYDIPAYYYAGWDSPYYTIAAEYLGEFERYGFHTREELKSKLRKELVG